MTRIASVLFVLFVGRTGVISLEEGLMNITRTAINRPVTVTMFVVAFMLFGLVSLDRLSLNLLPDISYPSLTIQT
ncbi:MAG: efflux RND transporter permease subunit, partial [Acidobacteria bacterium]